jgi:hypothetical protein
MADQINTIERAARYATLLCSMAQWYAVRTLQMPHKRASPLSALSWCAAPKFNALSRTAVMHRIPLSSLENPVAARFDKTVQAGAHIAWRIALVELNQAAIGRTEDS